MPLCFVSIGSNIDRERNVAASLTALRETFGPLLISSVYETTAVGFAGSPFYNLAAAFVTDMSVEQLREALQHIEASRGRTRDTPRHGPRTLDIDILFYGNLIQHDDHIDVPRREICNHAFVLGPLAEIAGDLQNPETGKPVADSWEKFEGSRMLAAVRFTLRVG